jgi:hypothetical protein
MTLSDVCIKYKISDAFLNSKDDALKVAAESLRELSSMAKSGIISVEDIAAKMDYLSEFLIDVKTSGY